MQRWPLSPSWIYDPRAEAKNDEHNRGTEAGATQKRLLSATNYLGAPLQIAQKDGSADLEKSPRSLHECFVQLQPPRPTPT